MAATETQRGKSQSNHLHRDFSFPVLKPWGNKRLLGYESADGKGEGVAVEDRSDLPSPAPVRDCSRRFGAPKIGYMEEDCRLEELREKLMGHLREAADRMKVDIAPIKPAAPNAVTVAQIAPASSPAETTIPWTLRKRRARSARAMEGIVRLRSDEEEKKELKKFSVSLSKEEIEEDVFALTGSRPRRRPKKRRRIVQRQLDSIFPGLMLPEITLETYKVTE